MSAAAGAGSQTRGLFRPVSPAAFRVALTLYLLLRVWLVTLPGYVSDLDGYKDWALGAARWGIPAAYEKTIIDYPPLLLYLLVPFGHAYLALHPEIAAAEAKQAAWGEYFFETPDGRRHRSWTPIEGVPGRHLPAEPMPGAAVFTAMLKGLFALFDLALAGLVYWIVARRGLWGAARAGPGWGRLAALLYLWNPAILFSSGYWGQADGLHCALAVAALALLGLERFAASGAALAAAGLAKPLAAPLVPLLALAAAERGRLGGFVRAGAGGIAMVLLAFLPWIATGRAWPVAEKVFLDLDAMAYTSVNAHNLWWLLGAWRNANAPLLGGLSPKAAGQSLFLLVYAALLWRSRSWMARAPAELFAARLFVLGAAVTALFFFLSTHLHENHLLMAIPLLLAVAGRSRALAGLLAAATLASLVNMATHDLVLPRSLPGVLGAAAPASRELTGVELSWTQLVASYANSLLVAAVAGGCALAAWRGRR